MKTSEIWAIVGEAGGGGLLVALGWKYLVPIVKNLYKELKELRKENAELKEKLAYLKGKYMDKVVLKSHGKRKEEI